MEPPAAISSLVAAMRLFVTAARLFEYDWSDDRLRTGGCMLSENMWDVSKGV